MNSNSLNCKKQCAGTNRDMTFPGIDPDRLLIRIAMISEAPSPDPLNYFYKDTGKSFFQTTMTAFQDAGIKINNYNDLTELGVYLTTAIKCSKKDYLVPSETIRQCSEILEKELSQFPNLKVIMCMGDFAIKAVNFIYKRKYGIAAVKSGSTYRIRKEVHKFEGIRFFPSYTQTGESFNLEKSKRRMIAEDIKSAMTYIGKY